MNRIPTLNEAFAAYLEVRKIKGKVLGDYRSKFRKVEQWHELRLDEISCSMAERLHHEIAETAPSQADYTMKMLSTVFNFSMHHFLTEDGKYLPIQNPIKRLQTLRKWHQPLNERHTHSLTNEQLKVWWQEANRMQLEHVRDLLKFLLLTGCPLSEAVSLSWSDLDFSKQLVVLRKPKSSRVLLLPFSDYVAEMLKARRAMHPTNNLIFAGCSDREVRNPYYAIRQFETKFSPINLQGTFRRILMNSCNAHDEPLKLLIRQDLSNIATSQYLHHIETWRHYMRAVTTYVLKLVGEKDEITSYRILRLDDLVNSPTINLAPSTVVTTAIGVNNATTNPEENIRRLPKSEIDKAKNGKKLRVVNEEDGRLERFEA